MEGICSLEYILSSESLFSSLAQRMQQDLMVVSWSAGLFSAVFDCYFSADRSMGSIFSTSLNFISQFFWMYEQNRFLILFSGRPGKFLLISDHLLPILLKSSRIFLSSSYDQSSLLILGSSLLMYLSRICFPFLEPSISEISFQFLPYFLMSLRMVSSSWEDQILWLLPSCTSLLYR